MATCQHQDVFKRSASEIVCPDCGAESAYPLPAEGSVFSRLHAKLVELRAQLEDEREKWKTAYREHSDARIEERKEIEKLQKELRNLRDARNVPSVDKQLRSILDTVVEIHAAVTGDDDNDEVDDPNDGKRPSVVRLVLAAEKVMRQLKKRHGTRGLTGRQRKLAAEAKLFDGHLTGWRRTT